MQIVWGLQKDENLLQWCRQSERDADVEVCGPGVACDCGLHNGLHIQEDYFYPEIISADTLEPIADGEVGELVFTTLTKEGMPLLRYRTKDLTIMRLGWYTSGSTCFTETVSLKRDFRTDRTTYGFRKPWESPHTVSEPKQRPKRYLRTCSGGKHRPLSSASSVPMTVCGPQSAERCFGKGTGLYITKKRRRGALYGSCRTDAPFSSGVYVFLIISESYF